MTQGLTELDAIRWCRDNNAFVQFSKNSVLIVTNNPVRAKEAETLVAAVFQIVSKEGHPK